MILSDKHIKEELSKGGENRLFICPYPKPEQWGSCTIDLRLGNEFKILDYSQCHRVNVDKEFKPVPCYQSFSIKNDEFFLLRPGQFALAIVKEYIEIPDNLIGRLDGKSSLARLGLIVHGTASIFDAGFKGYPVLELKNIGEINLELHPSVSICSMSFEMLSSEVDVPYYSKSTAKYNNQNSL